MTGLDTSLNAVTSTFSPAQHHLTLLYALASTTQYIYLFHMNFALKFSLCCTRYRFGKTKVGNPSHDKYVAVLLPLLNLESQMVSPRREPRLRRNSACCISSSLLLELVVSLIEILEAINKPSHCSCLHSKCEPSTLRG